MQTIKIRARGRFTRFARVFSCGFLATLFVGAFVLVTPQIASADQIAGQPYPVFTIDGTGYGTENNSVSYARFGGTAFVPETSFRASSVQVHGCSSNGSTTPILIYMDLYHALPSYVFGGTNDYATDAELLDTWAGTFENCTFGMADIDMNGAWDFDIANLPLTFTANERYFFVFREADIQNNVISDLSFYTSNAPADNISVCRISAFCGGQFLSEDNYTMWLSFAGTGQPPLADSPCVISELPYIDVQQCIINAGTYLFVPSEATIQEFNTMSTLASTTVFRLSYDSLELFNTLLGSNATTSAILSINFNGEPLELVDSSKFNDYLPMLPTIRALISAFIWLGATMVVIRAPMIILMGH